MNWALRYLVKEAARSRWLFRRGLLSGPAAKQLRSSGVLPSAERYTAGLERGSEALKTKYGIKEIPIEYVSPHLIGGEKGTLMTPKSGPRIPVGATILTPDRFKGFPAGHAEKMMAQYGNRVIMTMSPEDFAKTAPATIPKWAPADWAVRQAPLTRRHEINELRMLTRGNPDAEFSGVGSKYFTHVSPKIIQMEGQDAMGLDPVVRRLSWYMRHNMSPSQTLDLRGRFPQLSATAGLYRKEQDPRGIVQKIMTNLGAPAEKMNDPEYMKRLLHVLERGRTHKMRQQLTVAGKPVSSLREYYEPYKEKLIFGGYADLSPAEIEAEIARITPAYGPHVARRLIERSIQAEKTGYSPHTVWRSVEKRIHPKMARPENSVRDAAHGLRQSAVAAGLLPFDDYYTQYQGPVW